MIIHAHTDGASRGNPGESGIGVILRDENGNILFSDGSYIGVATNNVAEYRALLFCIEKARQLPCKKLIVYSDSQLIVRQLRGEYRVRDKNLQKYFLRANRLLKDSQFIFEIKHIEREKNREADLLANAGIDRRKNLKV